MQMFKTMNTKIIIILKIKILIINKNWILYFKILFDLKMNIKYNLI